MSPLAIIAVAAGVAAAGCGRNRAEAPAGGGDAGAPRAPIDDGDGDRRHLRAVDAFYQHVTNCERAVHDELGNYLGTGRLETDLWEPRPGDDTPPAEWRVLGLSPPPAELGCAYVVLAGTEDEAVPGLFGEELFGSAFPGVDWWYLIARCGPRVYGRANLSPALRVLRKSL